MEARRRKCIILCIKGPWSSKLLARMTSSLKCNEHIYSRAQKPESLMNDVWRNDSYVYQFSGKKEKDWKPEKKTLSDSAICFLRTNITHREHNKEIRHAVIDPLLPMLLSLRTKPKNLFEETGAIKRAISVAYSYCGNSKEQPRTEPIYSLPVKARKSVKREIKISLIRTLFLLFLLLSPRNNPA